MKFLIILLCLASISLSSEVDAFRLQIGFWEACIDSLISEEESVSIIANYENIIGLLGIIENHLLAIEALREYGDPIDAE